MTKYIAFKIFDTEDHGSDWEIIKKKQTDRYYTVVHEDYIVPVLQSELKQGRYIKC